MLPEAESELIPVHIRDKNRALHGSSQNHLSNGYKRKSRSMESFGINAQRNRQSQSYSVAQSQVDIAEVPIASSPTAATASVTSKEPTRSMKSQYSQTDLHVDAESDVIMAPSAKVRTASIGRSTQCPLPKPPKRTSASVYGHKRNGSIRSMNDIEKEILYGRETMLA